MANKRQETRNKTYKTQKRNGSCDENKRRVDPDSSSKSKMNDVSWYAKNSQLLKDAASISYNTALGAALDFENTRSSIGKVFYASDVNRISGVMAIHYLPTPGLSHDNSSPVNIAARNIYSFVRHANSGHSNYDSPDLMLYLLAMDNMYAVYNMGKRVYGIARHYSQYNRYTPEVILKALGFNPSDVYHNLASLRYGLNIAAAKLNSLSVPTTMSILTRHSWMNSNIYKDADEFKAQIYLYRQRGYYTYSESSSPRGGKLTYSSFPGDLTVASYLDILNSMIAALLESEDINIMSGDILKAYGTGKLWTLGSIGEEYSIEPVYNAEVLNQMHNATAFGSDCNNLDITQDPDTGAILFAPTYGSNSAILAYTEPPIIVNQYKSNVEPADTMVATRLMCQLKQKLDSTGTFKDAREFATMGTEFCTSFEIYTIGADNAITSTQYLTIVPFADQPSILQVTTAARMSHFDWHPISYWFSGTKDKLTQTLQCFFCDVSNFAVIDINTLNKMHTTAILSEFDVPVNGVI